MGDTGIHRRRRPDGTAGDRGGRQYQRVQAPRKRCRRVLQRARGHQPRVDAHCGESHGRCHEHARRSRIVGCPAERRVDLGPGGAHRSRRGHDRSDADKTARGHGRQLERVSEGCRWRVARGGRPTTAPSVERRPRVRHSPRRLPAPPDPGSQRQRRGSRGAATRTARRAAADRGREPP